MFTRHTFAGLVAAVAALATPAVSFAADPFADVVEKSNKKLVKLFGAGGFSRLNNYGTGIVISKDGFILTVASQLLDTSDLVVKKAVTETFDTTYNLTVKGAVGPVLIPELLQRLMEVIVR